MPFATSVQTASSYLRKAFGFTVHSTIAAGSFIVFLDESVLNCIGNTPLLKVKIRFEGQEYELHAKLEFMNPSGTIKDQIAKWMVGQAEGKGLLKSATASSPKLWT